MNTIFNYITFGLFATKSTVNLDLTDVLQQLSDTQSNLNAIVTDRQDNVKTLENKVNKIRVEQSVLTLEAEKAARISAKYDAFLE